MSLENHYFPSLLYVQYTLLSHCFYKWQQDKEKKMSPIGKPRNTSHCKHGNAHETPCHITADFITEKDRIMDYDQAQ